MQKVSKYKLDIPEFPELEIGDRTFQVNNRKSNYDKMLAAQAELTSDADTVLVMAGFLLGEEGVEYIKGLDLPMGAYADLAITLSAAVLDITFEEAQERFQSKISA